MNIHVYLLYFYGKKEGTNKITILVSCIFMLIRDKTKNSRKYRGHTRKY